MDKSFFTYTLSVLLFLMCLALPVPHGFAESDSLQQLIEETPEGGTLHLEGVTYNGNIEIKKPITITGTDGTHIKGDGTASVIEVEAEQVAIENVHVSNSGMDQSSDEEYTGIRVMASDATIRNVKITDVYHGIYLTRADNTTIDETTIIGQASESLAKQGNGIHIIRSVNNTITNNNIEYTRDGIYIEYANGNEITGNTVQHARYGLHYMYSDYNNFYENHFTGNIGGAAIMQSDHITIENNHFSYNQGSRAFGLLLQSSNNIEVKDNEFFLNHRGLSLDMSTNNRIEENHFFKNEIGVELWTSSTAHVLVKNHFKQNQLDVLTLGGKSFNDWFENGEGNYWDTPMIDLDHDGISDHPHQSTSALANLIEDNELTYRFLHSPAIQMYETMNAMTSSQQVMAEDDYPLTPETNDASFSIYHWVVLLGGIGFIASIGYVKKRRNA